MAAMCHYEGAPVSQPEGPSILWLASTTSFGNRLLASTGSGEERQQWAQDAH